MRRALLALAVAALGAAAWSVVAHPWGWLYAFGVHPYPASSSTPWTYQMWSGIIPALTVLTLIGAVISLYHVHNCHQDGCWRIGKHRVGGTPWCNRHLSQAKPERCTEELLERIEAALNRVAVDSKLANDSAMDLNQQILAELRQPR